MPSTLQGYMQAYYNRQYEFIRGVRQSLPLVNPIHAERMDQDAGFGGTPIPIHDGGDTSAWTPTANAGAWNFADAGRISITNANDGDQAIFEEPTATPVDMTNYAAITGIVNVTSYAVGSQEVRVWLTIGGVIVGNNRFLESYVNMNITGVDMQFSIPKEDFGVTTQSIDGFVIDIERAGGAAPTLIFDDIQIEETGGELVYTLPLPPNSTFYTETFRIIMAATFDASVVNGTMTGLNHKDFFSLGPLNNGIDIRIAQEDFPAVAFIARNLGELFLIGLEVPVSISDGTETYVVLEAKADFVLDSTESNRMMVTINDQLGSMDRLSMFVDGCLVLN